MLNAIIVTFVKRHPIMTFFLVVEVAGAARDTVVGVTRAITGNYPPEKKPEPTELPKVDISIQKPQTSEESEEETEEVSGEVADILS